MKQSHTFIILSLSLFLSFTECLDPVICSQKCPDGYLVNPDCSCTEGRMCIALACPEGQRRDFRDCGCKDQDSILPNQPIVCENTRCKPGYKISPQCECVRDQNIVYPEPPAQCLIDECHHHFHLNSKCQCKRNRGATCRKGCPKGMTIYAIPGIINCNCEPRVRCPIDSCARNAELIDCKCVPRKPSKCGIRKCKRMFELDRKKCRCRVIPSRTCRKRCPPGKMIKPGTFCDCVRRPRCEIQKCRSKFRLDLRNCKCIKRGGFWDWDNDFDF
jgi:hypothetical protein